MSPRADAFELHAGRTRIGVAALPIHALARGYALQRWFELADRCGSRGGRGALEVRLKWRMGDTACVEPESRPEFWPGQ